MFHGSHVLDISIAESPRLFKSGTLSDFEIVCGEDHYKVHKVVLYSQSKYFAKVFSGNFKVMPQNEASQSTIITSNARH